MVLIEGLFTCRPLENVGSRRQGHCRESAYAALLSRQVERRKTESRLDMCHPRCSDVDDGSDDANINGNQKDAEPSDCPRVRTQSNDDS